ncbi:MAG: TonB-dependent receptor [Telluria sp.]
MIKETVLARSVRMMCAGGLVLGAGFAAAPAWAQQVAADAPMARVEITGSAIKRIDGETSVPVTVIKIDDLKKEGITTVEQVMSTLSVSQAQVGTSQVVGTSSGGAAFADLRGSGANKTLVLLNGRRLANNALDSSAPDLNMIPFAAIERVEVLRDGASALYGSDAVGGVINFITRKDYRGATVSVGADSPQKQGGFSDSFNAGVGHGDLDKDGFNVFAMIDHQMQHRIGGGQRPYNTRYDGGASSSTSPANYYQGDQSYNPAAPGCTAGTNLFKADATSCAMATAPFIDYVPKSERTTGLLKGTLKLNADHELGIEYMASRSKVGSTIAPVPYGGLFMNRTRPDGSANPYYPGNPALDPNFSDGSEAYTDGLKPGYIHVKWRDLPNGNRHDENINNQQRLVVSLSGNVAGWDYDGALTWNQNKVEQYLFGYSDGDLITKGVLNGVINPFGAQDAAGTALLNSAGLGGNIANGKGTSKGFDLHASRELADWFGAGRAAALAIGAQADRQDFVSASNHDFAAKVVASTGIDPDSHNEGSRSVYAAYAELNVPITRTLDVTAALRADKYSDFGSTTNPKVSFRYQPAKAVLVRGSYSTGFRAPSLYDINAGQAYTNSADTMDDPVNCPGGKPIPGKSAAANCAQQFETLNGGNNKLQPEKSQNASLGIMIEPVNNLSVGVDFWAIRVKHLIGVLADTDVLGSPTTFAAYIHRTAAGDLATDGSQCPNPATCGYLDLRTQNLGNMNTNGLDIAANYRIKDARLGTFTFGLNSTYVNKFEKQNFIGDLYHNNVNEFFASSNVFRWQDTINVNWSKGDLGAGVIGHYKSGYIDADPSNRVASYSTVDAFGSYKLMGGLTLTAGVRNLFDREPPLSYQTYTFQSGFDPRYTDPTGRTFYVRGTYNF